MRIGTTSAGWIVPQQQQRVGHKVCSILRQRTRDRMGGVEDLDPRSGTVQPRQAERFRTGTAVEEQQNGVTGDPPPALVDFVRCLASNQHPEYVIAAVLPLRGGHLLPIRSEPGEILPRTFTAAFLAEEGPPPENGIGGANRKKVPSELQEIPLER